MSRSCRILPLLSAMLALGLAGTAAGRTPAGAPAPPDTGLFAPVARLYRARLEHLRAMPADQVPPGRLRLLLATGQPDEAARLAPRCAGDPREVAVARAEVELARQDFAALAPAIDELVRLGPLRDDERALRFAWCGARDDAPAIDSLSRDAVAGHDDAHALPELLAAGRQAYDRLDYARADSLFARALSAASEPGPGPAWSAGAARPRSLALTGRALVQQKRRDWDGSLATLRAALAADGNAEVLMATTETLLRLGRIDDAISAAEWGVRLAPYNDLAHYMLGNGYARRNYTQLFAAYPAAFAELSDRAALERADARLGAGRRDLARSAYAAIVRAHPAWADARVRLASLDFEDGRFAESRDGCFAALRVCPEYGRAHAVLAKALEAQRFVVDVHRTDYEARFAAAPMPEVPGIEKFVTNWRSLSPRHQKRVALSIAPWKAYVPVLIAGGATYFIKPVYMRLSECPDQETLHDQRIDYDSRLWDDVRGCGGYHTVTGIEDVERTIFDRYNTVLHELTHQVHGVLPADDSRRIQEHYRRAKARDDATRDGFLSRYAGGSVYEYFAEGANGLYSPMRDRYDSREVTRERLDRIDPDLRALVEGFMARTDVSASYPIAYAAGGDDRVERGRVGEALPLYRQALSLEPDNETALVALARALTLGNRAGEAESVAARAVVAHPTSGPARVALAIAAWHAGHGLDAARGALDAGRASVRAEDRYLVNVRRGIVAWTAGDAPAALAAFDSVLAYQSDNPEGLQGRAAALALAGRTDEAFAMFDRAVRMRTGVVELRCAYARELLRAGRTEAARAQLAEAGLIDEENPTAETLRAWADLAAGDLSGARTHARRARAWGPWSDLALIVSGAIERRAGDAAAADAAWAPVERRIASQAPPEYVYRPKLAVWEETHTLPAVERAILDSFRKGAAPAPRTTPPR